MGRYKKLEVKGLFFKDFREIFEKGIQAAVETRNPSKKEIRDKLLPKLPELFTNYEETTAVQYAEHHKFSLKEMLRSHSKSQKAFAEENQECFTLFSLYITVSITLYSKIILRINRKKIDSTLRLTVILYGLIVRKAEQINYLLLSQDSDAAMVLWRSFYESSITLLVIAGENNPVLAERFFEHSRKNSINKVESWNLHHKKLKMGKLSKSAESRAEAEKEALVQKYGKDFFKNEYWWADDLFPGNEKASFRKLEKKVEMERFRPYYLLSTEQVHSSFSSFSKYTLGRKVILPWLISKDTSMRSLIDPMQFTVAVLEEVNNYILYEFSEPYELDVNILYVHTIFDNLLATLEKSAKRNN